MVTQPTDVFGEPRRPLGLLVLLACTHVALIFDAVVFLPNILARSGHVAPEHVQPATFAMILVSAVCTLIQAVRPTRLLGCGHILFMGSYSAFLACSLQAAELGGMPLVAGMTLLCSVVVFFYSFFLRFLRNIITPAVGGVMIILVGLTLTPIAIELWQGGDPSAAGFQSMENYLTGLATAVTLICLVLFGGRTLRLWAPMLAIGAGYLAAGSMGLLHLAHTASAAWIGLPHGSWPGLSMDVSTAHISLLVAFGMAALISAMEGTGNLMFVQKVSEPKQKDINYTKIQGGLFCDALGKALCGLCGTAPLATYSDNIPIIEMTQVPSRLVGVLGAGLLFVLAFIPKAAGFILDMPSPVVGGLLLVITAILFYAGISLVISSASGFTFQRGIMLGASLCAGLVAESRDFFPEIIPVGLAPILQNGVAVGGATAVLFSLMLRLSPKPRLDLRLEPREDELRRLNDALEDKAKRLQLGPNGLLRLGLACEEIFLHVLATSEKAVPVNFHFERQEGRLFVEIVSGSHVGVMDHSDSLAAPVTDEELDSLGLRILHRMAREVHRIHISGYTYISFLFG